MSEGYVLDTSAVLSLIENEPGAERVETILHQEAVWLPWIVLLETYYISRQEQSKAEADLRYALLKQLPTTIIWQADEAVMLKAARLKAGYRLSLADAIVAAFAIRQNATLLHKDPEFEAIHEHVMLEVLPYKGSSM